MTFTTLAALVLVLGLQQAPPAQPASTDARLKVFVDCPDTSCYLDYLRDEITFVEYVRDRKDADLHVLVTSVETGSGGLEYTLSFIGLQQLADRKRTMTMTIEQSDSEDRRRQRLATVLTIGLLDFVAARGLPTGLAVSVEAGATTTRASTLAADPWHHWIFSLRGDAEFNAEESTRELNLGLSASADRITPEWKITVGAGIDYEREQYDLDEEDPYKTTRRERELEALVVRSLNEHWSVGAMGEARSSTFDNYAVSVAAAPAIEWNFFPYSEYTRRQLRAQYALGWTYSRYHEESLFGKTREGRFKHEASITYEQREPWGTVETRFEWANTYPGFSKYRLELDGELSLRITRGLSLNFDAYMSRIRDQLSLPKRDATPEEVLLRLRQLGSGYELRFEAGLTYQFGSIFTSIVNPRFGQ